MEQLWNPFILQTEITHYLYLCVCFKTWCLEIHLIIFCSSFPLILCYSPWIHLENFVLKRSFWGLKILIKTFLKTCCEDHFLHLQVPWFHAYPLHILQGQSSEKLGPDYVSTAIFMNTIGNHDNRFHQNFHSNTKVEKVINVPCHLDFELNHRKLCLPFSSSSFFLMVFT